MSIGHVGDELFEESERVGLPRRKGKVLEVLGAADTVHYLVRWEDGHESTIYPSAGTVTFVAKAAKSGRR